MRIARAIASFVGHQLFSTIGIGALTPIALFSLVPALRLFQRLDRPFRYCHELMVWSAIFSASLERLTAYPW